MASLPVEKFIMTFLVNKTHRPVRPVGLGVGLGFGRTTPTQKSEEAKFGSQGLYLCAYEVYT